MHPGTPHPPHPAAALDRSPRYAERARRELGEQHAALEERPIGRYRQLTMFVQSAEDVRGQVRIALGELDDVRTQERAYAQAIEEDVGRA